MGIKKSWTRSNELDETVECNHVSGGKLRDLALLKQKLTKLWSTLTNALTGLESKIDAAYSERTSGVKHVRHQRRYAHDEEGCCRSRCEGHHEKRMHKMAGGQRNPCRWLRN